MVVRVHEGQSLVTVGALLRVAFVHGVNHHCHFLAGAVQRLLTLLGQFPSGEEETERNNQATTTRARAALDSI